MEPIQYLRALRQWWWVIVASVVVGVVLAVFLVPGGTTEYTASQTLLSVGSSSGQSAAIPTLDQMAILVTAGEVPRLAAAELKRSPGDLGATVTATADSVGGTLRILATGANPSQTAAVADAYAKQLVASIDGKAKAQYQKSVDKLQTRVDDLTAEIKALPATPDGEAGRNSLQPQLDDANTKLSELNGQGAPTSGLQSVQSAAAVASSSGTSRTKRALIAGLVGLLIGTGLALLLTRFDTRLHSREAVDEAFGFPVIAEIPLVSRSQNRKGPVVVHSDRDSPPAEAYRSLRSTLLLAPRSRRSVGEVRDRARRHTPRRSADDHAHAIMVVSPSVGEGKSTCVANLAAAFGESGKRVLVLSCDLRRPAIDRYLDAPKDAPGVSEVLADGKDLEAVLCDTAIPGVRIVPSGRPISNPGELLTHGEDLLAAARRIADIVIVDTPPVLATDDMSAMIPLVDDVVIVCRAGSTGAEAARRSAERLNRLGAPIAGVVIIGAQSLPAVRGYYRSYVSKDAARTRAEAYKPAVDGDVDPRQHPPDQSPA